MKYSVVIPVYNSATIVGRTIDDVVDFFDKQQLSYELILVNDGSQDMSWDVIQSKAKDGYNIIAINLLRNYGQHTAMYCGLKHSNGDFVITIDDDLQNPPQEMIHLIHKSLEGYDLVFGRFKQKRHSSVRVWGSSLIRLVNQRIFFCPPDLVPTNFRLIRRDVVERILQFQTFYPYITGLVLMFATNATNVWVEHRERPEGKSNYNLTRIISLVFRILFNYSSWPLRVVTSIGFVVSLFSFLIGLYLMARKLLDQVQLEGWTGIMVLLSFLGGLIIFILGMLGEYLIRILQQVSHQQNYHIKEVVKNA